MSLKKLFILRRTFIKNLGGSDLLTSILRPTKSITNEIHFVFIFLIALKYYFPIEGDRNIQSIGRSRLKQVISRKIFASIHPYSLETMG